MAKRTRHLVALGASIAVVATVSIWAGAASADVATDKRYSYTVQSGTVWIDFGRGTLDELGWGVAASGLKYDDLAPGETAFNVEPSLMFRVHTAKGLRDAVIDGTLRTSGALLLTGHGDRVVIGNLAVETGANGVWTVTTTLKGPDAGQVVFHVSSLRTDLYAAEQNLRVVGDLSVAASWAEYLGIPGAAGIVLGSMTIDVDLRRGRQVTPVEEAETCATPSVSTVTASDGEGVTAGRIGSDVIIADLQSVIRYGRKDGITAYSVGTNACNIGDQRASWIKYTNQHPLIFSSIYRLKDGRFEEIGMSWVKHGFFALSKSLCGPCLDPTNGSQLGVGCSDPYSAYLNGVQGNMSLRSDANAHTGYFPYPWSAPDWDDITDKRMQVHDVDIDPDLNEDAWYFVQGHYIHPDDAAAGTHDNNASYRPVSVLEPSPNDFNVVVIGVTQRQQPGIRAWQDTDNSVVETDIRVPGEGYFILAVKVTDLQSGFWHYDYAIENINSDRSAGLFRIPLPRGAVVQNIGFHDVDYHSGEIYDLTDWPATVQDGAITWATDSYDVNCNANALRFSTLYNFRFDTNIGPGSTTVILELFKPGEPGEVAARTTGPSLAFLDCNNNDISDVCDIRCEEDCEPPCGGSVDCNHNEIPDECEPDCNANGVADSCDIANETSNDCNENTVPDECEPDCDNDGIPDDCDTFEDTDGDGIFDCFDLCPLTTPEGACVCPNLGLCCFPSGICIHDFPRLSCIEDGGTPDCIETPCRNGCLIGDSNADGKHDLRDVAHMQRCYSSPFGTAGFETPLPGCTLHFDFDEDDDIDLDDYEAWHAVQEESQSE